MGPDGNTSAVSKAELLYYFASICDPEGVLAAKMMPMFDELIADFDRDSDGELDFHEFFDLYEYAMDMSIQAYGPVEFLLFWFVHPVLTQMGGEQFDLSTWKGEMRGSQVNQKLVLTMDINPDLICSPTSGRDGGDCERATYGVGANYPSRNPASAEDTVLAGWKSSRTDDDSLYVQGYYYDSNDLTSRATTNRDVAQETTFKPRVSCARTHALAQTTLKQTLEDLLGVHAAEYINQQVNHLGKACPAIEITLNVPNASKTLNDLTIVKSGTVSCAPGGTMVCLQIAQALGMEYLYKAVDPGFATSTHAGNPTGGQVETDFTFTNTNGGPSNPFFSAAAVSMGANGSYTAAIVEPSCPAELGKGLLKLTAHQVND